MRGRWLYPRHQHAVLRLSFSSLCGVSSVLLLPVVIVVIIRAVSILTHPIRPAAVPVPSSHDAAPRKIPPPTPVVFPVCTPQAELHPPSPKVSLVALLQTIQRPTDLKFEHFEALGLHVIPDASPQDIIPDASFLPPVGEWTSIDPDDLEEANAASKKPLSNGNLSPGVQTYLERRKELSTNNTAAFRTTRRIPPLPNEAAVRLGNAYEFFKNLEFFSSYWPDTSQPPQLDVPRPPSPTGASDEVEKKTPSHLQTHVRTGTGSQLPPDYRQQLLSAFVKLVAYDFGCNVSFPRCEPRLQLTPSSSSSPPSYFTSALSCVYRTPTNRASARAGIVEGPVAGISCRTTTGFRTEPDSRFDLAREVVAVLLIAQHRAREGKNEKRFGEQKWWTTTPRWGGGPGGPIGREVDKPDELQPGHENDVASLGQSEGREKSAVEEIKRAIGGIGRPSPSKRTRRGKDGGTMQIYDNYRKLLPPSSNWDRKAKYCAIGKEPSQKEGERFDDIFLLSSLNHHVSVVRVRVPEKLLSVLDGNEEMHGWGRVMMWRSKWYDFFLADERIEAMEIVWGLMAYSMRKLDDPPPTPASAPEPQSSQPLPVRASEAKESDRMDMS